MCKSPSLTLAHYATDQKHSDNANGRVFANELPDNSALTVESCINSCASQGFSVAGMEYSGTFGRQRSDVRLATPLVLMHMTY